MNQIRPWPLLTAMMAKTSKTTQYPIRSNHVRKDKASAAWYWEQALDVAEQFPTPKSAVLAAVAVFCVRIADRWIVESMRENKILR